MEIEYSHWLSIAAIHATIIAIFITVSFAYLLFLRGRLDELESSVYQEANKINRLRFADSSGLKIEDKYVCSDDKTRLELAGILGNIAVTGTPQLGLFEEKDLSIEEKKAVVREFSVDWPSLNEIGDVVILNKPMEEFRMARKPERIVEEAPEKVSIEAPEEKPTKASEEEWWLES